MLFQTCDFLSAVEHKNTINYHKTSAYDLCALFQVFWNSLDMEFMSFLTENLPAVSF